MPSIMWTIKMVKKGGRERTKDAGAVEGGFKKGAHRTWNCDWDQNWDGLSIGMIRIKEGCSYTNVTGDCQKLRVIIFQSLSHV